jgi:hypothetical protein
MTSTRRFRVNAPNVVSEIIEGEAVIVNLQNGLYYSTERTGAEVWALVEQRVPVPAIVGMLAHQYTGSREEIEAGVDAFITQLEAERLVVPDDGEAALPEAPAATPEASDAYRPRFEAPAISRYVDMEDLLLLDPIHEANV